MVETTEVNNQKEIPKCELCDERHKIFEDGFEYFDCWNHKLKMEKNKNEKNKI